MGGLVARYWLGGLCASVKPRAGDCAALITVGTPHHGAPKALDWLVNGIRVGRAPSSAHDILSPGYLDTEGSPPG
jgi:triacylglycerol esterase/lipase EstA (alpha/beta hydrolase family)